MADPTRSTVDADELSAAMEHGKICAVAVACQRGLRAYAKTHPDLFPDDQFDAGLFSAIALASAFGSPWATSDQLTVAARASLWIFVSDWVLERVAKSRDEVHQIVRECLAVADGGVPSGETSIACVLGDIRDELAEAPAFTARRSLWRDRLRRYLVANAREWEWNAARAATGGAVRPTFQEYLDNADNCGSSWVNVSHWIYTADSRAVAHLDEIMVASDEAQRVLRLLNDLATYERELGFGDLNALVLGADRAEVAELMTALVARFRELVMPLRAGCPQQAVYLERQIGYNTGFYRVNDYWGAS
jgi:hypothetical protein